MSIRNIAESPGEELEQSALIEKLDREDALVLTAGPPPRRVILPVEAIEANDLGIGELMDMAEVLGTDLEGVSRLMRAGKGAAQTRVVVAYAWILARRQDPAVTWLEAQRWRIEVTSEPDPKGSKQPSAEGHG